MATIGRNHAVVDLRHVHFAGWFAWITWMFIHLISLLGMRNKAIVLLNWIWSYFTFSSSLRLILRPSCNPSSPGNKAAK
jgi:NADH dehydrogenase